MYQKKRDARAKLLFCLLNLLFLCFRGRLSKGKGKEIWVRDRSLGRREAGNAYKDANVFAIPPTNYAYKNNATLNMCERIAVK